MIFRTLGFFSEILCMCLTTVNIQCFHPPALSRYLIIFLNPRISHRKKFLVCA
eukprot:UN26090